MQPSRIALVTVLLFSTTPALASGNATLRLSRGHFALTFTEHVRKIFRRDGQEQRYHEAAKKRLARAATYVVRAVETVIVRHRQNPTKPLGKQIPTCSNHDATRRYPCALVLTVDRRRFSVTLRAHVVRRIDAAALASFKRDLALALRSESMPK